MPNNQTQKLTHGAMAIALFVIFIIVISYVPIIRLIAILFAPLPLVWFSAKYDRSTSIFVGVVGCIIAFFFGGLLTLLLSIFFAMCGVIMGDVIRTKKSKFYLLMATGISILAFISILYLIAVRIFEIDFIKESIQLTKTNYMDYYKWAESITGQKIMNEETFDLMFQMVEMAMPASITLLVFLFAFIMISVNLPMLKRLGVPVPKFNAFKDLCLPRITLLLYFIVLVIQFFVRPDVGSPLFVIVLNFNIILQVLLIIQGISLLQFVLHAYKVSKFLTVLVTIMAISLSNFMILLGILDLGLNLRSYVKGKIQK